MNFNDLLKNISGQTFADIISTSPRRVREALFSHYGIKVKSHSLIKSITAKKEERAKLLHKIMMEAENVREQELIKELFRNWLFHQRPLLKATLDYLGVENDNGLVEIDTDFFKELDQERVADLIAHLAPDFPRDAILIYLTFMEVPYLKQHFAR